jgi:hypothetical protein
VSDDRGQIGIVDTADGSVRNLTDFSTQGFTDIAVGPDGGLIGITVSSFWDIDFLNGTATQIFDYSEARPDVLLNGLTFDPDGSLYAMGAFNSDLWTIDLDDGNLTSVGEVEADNTKRFSGGDLASLDGELFAATTPTQSPSETDAIVEIDPGDSLSSSVAFSFSSDDYPRIYGLAGSDGQLFAFQDTSVFKVMDINGTSPGFADAVSWETSELGNAWGAAAMNGAFQQIAVPGTLSVLAFGLAIITLWGHGRRTVIVSGRDSPHRHVTQARE